MLPDPSDAPVTARLVGAARICGEDVDAAIELCRDFGRDLPLPGRGATALRWSVLRELGRANLTAARVFEAHTDALAILSESGRDLVGDRRTWGVFAAEAPGAKLEALATPGGVTLSGTKPWCSLGGSLDAALVTAHQGETRGLYAVDLRHAGVRADPPGTWVARGLRTVTSGPVSFDTVPAEPVGGPQWYLHRDGFAWGGIGVAACWHGGAQGLADSLLTAARNRRRDLDALHVGAVDAALHSSACALQWAASAIDNKTVDAPDVLALRTRAIVAAAVESVLHHVGHALGPAPMSFDEAHAARVADLTLYVRQHHGERDLASLGSARIGYGE